MRAIKESVRTADERPERSVPHDRVKAWVESWGPNDKKDEVERPR